MSGATARHTPLPLRSAVAPTSPPPLSTQSDRKDFRRSTTNSKPSPKPSASRLSGSESLLALTSDCSDSSSSSSKRGRSSTLPTSLRIPSDSFRRAPRMRVLVHRNFEGELVFEEGSISKEKRFPLPDCVWKPKGLCRGLCRSTPRLKMRVPKKREHYQDRSRESNCSVLETRSGNKSAQRSEEEREEEEEEGGGEVDNMRDECSPRTSSASTGCVHPISPKSPVMVASDTTSETHNKEDAVLRVGRATCKVSAL